MNDRIALDHNEVAIDQTPLPAVFGFRLDRTAILARLQGDEELLRELIDLFMSDTPSLIKEAHQALASGDAETLQRTAHTIKGSVSNFGAGPAVEAAWQLEQMTHAGDLTASAAALSRVEQTISVVERELNQLLGAST